MAMTEDQLLAERGKTEWVRTIYLWKQDHFKDYDGTEESDNKIAAYFKAHHLELTYDNLNAAFTALRGQGETFRKKKELPPLPPVPGMRDPQIFTMGDINRMGERYKKLYFGPSSVQFRARVAEIIRRAKESGEDDVYLPEGEE